MKLYNVSFEVNGIGLSLVVGAETSHEAAANVKSLVTTFTKQAPRNVESNAVIFGADGPGESLNKLHKAAPKPKKTPAKKPGK